PFTMRVAHASARARFGDVPETEVAVVARAARHALRRLAGALDDPPYNLVVHSAPAGRSGRFHWYVEITARVLVIAGFEQATGIPGAESVLFCAVHTSVDADGTPLHAGDMAAQVNLALDNLEAVLTQAGLDLSNVVRLNYYTTDVDALFAAYEHVAGRLSQAG